MDEFIKDGIEAADSLADAPIARRWHIIGQRKDTEKALIEGAHRLAEGTSDCLSLISGIDAEQCLGGDGQRQFPHLNVQIADFAVVPSIDLPLGAGRHVRGVGQDAFALKDRLNQPPLPQPELAFTGQQTVAQEQAIHAQGIMLGEIAAMQYLFDERRVIDKPDTLKPKAHAGAVAVGTGAVQVEAERIMAHLRQIAAEKMAFGSRWDQNYAHRRLSPFFLPACPASQGTPSLARRAGKER